MMENPLISVIIPIYNVEQYLHACIKSVLEQSYRHWELILVNDGSTDNSLAICKEYAVQNKGVKVVDTKRGGVSAARNAGLQVAHGDYITFSDSDDTLEKDALMHYARAVGKYQPDIVKGGYKTIFYTGNTALCSNAEETCETNVLSFFDKIQENRYNTFLWNTLYKRSIVQGLQFDVTLCWLEDHIFTLECLLRARKMVVIDACVYNYMVRKRLSLSSITDPHMICLAARREFSLKQRIINGCSEKMLLSEMQSYHAKVNKAVCSIYQQHLSKQQRREFLENAILADESFCYSYEKLFFSPYIPFGMKDLCLSFKIFFDGGKDKVKQRIKAIVKKT